MIVNATCIHLLKDVVRQIVMDGCVTPNWDRHFYRDISNSLNRKRLRDHDINPRDGENHCGSNNCREDDSTMGGDFRRQRRRIESDQEPLRDSSAAFTFRPFPGAMGRNTTLDQPRAPPTKATVARGYAANDHTSSFSSGEYRAKNIQAGVLLKRSQLNMKVVKFFSKSQDISSLCNALRTVKQMLQCSNDLLFWIVHNVCNETISYVFIYLQCR
jgi:hypothetical protein